MKVTEMRSLRPGILVLLGSLLLAQAAHSAGPQGQPSATQLAINSPVERQIKSGEVHLYSVLLGTGQFLRGSVDQRGISINVKGYFPDGSKIRLFNGPPQGPKMFRIAAEAPGPYQLELKAADASASGSYQIKVELIQPMEERLKIVPEEKYHSPRLKGLQQELQAGKDGALESFWEEVRKKGTPLAEPLEGDARHLLATFLWRATFKTYNVLVVWGPYSYEHPDDYKMARLGNTDVWYKTLRIRKGARFLYQLSPNDTLSRAPSAQRYATAQADPLNPRRRPDNPNITKYEVSSIVELPGAPAQIWADQKPGVQAGSVAKHKFPSALLKNERDMSVYTPPGYNREGQPYGLLLLFDETTYLTDVPAPATLDNLVAEKRIPALVAVLIGNVSFETRERELTCKPEFTEFLRQELIPWVRQTYHVTSDPGRTIIGGISYGGLAAACAALRYPEIFGNVLAQSGAFWWAPDRDPANPARRDEYAEPNWVAKQVVASPKLPIRFFLEAGQFENDILETSRHLRDVLLAKGYEVHHQEFVGGHDRLSWRGSLADGLLALMGTRR